MRLGVEPTKGVPAGVVGKALRLEYRGRRAVLVLARGRHEALELVDRVLGGEGGFDFVVVAETAIIIETGVEPFEVDVPSQFDIIRAVPSAIPIVGGLNFPGLHIAALVTQNLLGGFHPVGASHERGVAEKLERKTGGFHVDLGAGMRRDSAVGNAGDRGLHPLQEIRRTVIHFRENPGTVFDVGDGGVLLEGVDKAAGHTFHITGVG